MSSRVAFLILVSGAAVTPARQGWWETEFSLRQWHFDQSDIDQALGLRELDDEFTRSGKGKDHFQAALERAKRTQWYQTAPVRPMPDAMRPFYRRIMDFDPIPIVGGLPIPSLWVFGARDEHVPVEKSVEILGELKAKGRPISFQVFEGVPTIVEG